MVKPQNKTQAEENMRSKHLLIEPTKKKKLSVLKWIVVVVIILLLLTAYKYFTVKKQIESRREAMQVQKQVMIDHWEKQGLSEEEIQKKLDESRQNSFDDSQRPPLMGIFRILRGGQRSYR